MGQLFLIYLSFKVFDDLFLFLGSYLNSLFYCKSFSLGFYVNFTNLPVAKLLVLMESIFIVRQLPSFYFFHSISCSAVAELQILHLIFLVWFRLNSQFYFILAEDQNFMQICSFGSCQTLV